MHPLNSRFVAVSLLASIAVSAIAPAAFAGHGNESHYKTRRYEGPQRGYGGSQRVTVVHSYPRRVVEYRRSGGGSGLAGFLGGVAVGAILTNAAQSHGSYHRGHEPQPVYCPPPQSQRCDTQDSRYSYEDPYCHERYASLDLYLSHTSRHCDHPAVARVIDNRDGDCVDVIRYGGNQWQSCEREQDGGRNIAYDRGYQGGDDGGYDN